MASALKSNTQHFIFNLYIFQHRKKMSTQCTKYYNRKNKFAFGVTNTNFLFLLKKYLQSVYGYTINNINNALKKQDIMNEKSITTQKY